MAARSFILSMSSTGYWGWKEGDGSHYSQPGTPARLPSPDMVHGGTPGAPRVSSGGPSKAEAGGRPQARP